MKHALFLFSGVVTILFLSSCQQENDTPAESQGTLYSNLLRTVTTSNYTGLKTTVNYNYNSSGKLTEIISEGINGGSANFLNRETFFRNASGQLDSALLAANSNGTGAIITTKNYFDGSGKIILSIQNGSTTGARDSCVYTYAGNILQQRTDYRSLNGGTYSLLRTGNYVFDAAGNLTRSVFSWTTHPGNDTLRFSYDSKVNPLPLDRLTFYWAPLFYGDYSPANNISQASNPSNSTYTTEYRYSANNKPVYRKTLYTGTGNYDETYYYYD